jgi:predicted RNA-binding Zn-ribbon protein involved in translation (DUF1610 family)
VNHIGLCPQCGSDWRDAPIPEAEHRKDRYGVIAPVQYYSRLIGIEIRGGYDGISFWRCPDCGAQWDRFTEKLVDRGSRA